MPEFVLEPEFVSPCTSFSNQTANIGTGGQTTEYTCMTLFSGANITIVTNATILIDNDLVIENGATLTLSSGATLNVLGSLTCGGMIVTSGNCTISPSRFSTASSSNITLTATTDVFITQALSHNYLTGTLQGNGTLNSFGYLSVPSGNTLTLNLGGGAFTRGIQLISDSLTGYSGFIINYGTIHVTGSTTITRALGGVGWSINGNVTIDFGQTLFTDAAGTFLPASTTPVIFTGPGTFDATTISVGSTVKLPAASVTFTGGIVLNGGFYFTGSPSSPVTFTINQATFKNLAGNLVLAGTNWTVNFGAFTSTWIGIQVLEVPAGITTAFGAIIDVPTNTDAFFITLPTSFGGFEYTGAVDGVGTWSGPTISGMGLFLAGIMAGTTTQGIALTASQTIAAGADATPTALSVITDNYGINTGDTVYTFSAIGQYWFGWHDSTTPQFVESIYVYAGSVGALNWPQDSFGLFSLATQAANGDTIAFHASSANPGSLTIGATTAFDF